MPPEPHKQAGERAGFTARLTPETTRLISETKHTNPYTTAALRPAPSPPLTSEPTLAALASPTNSKLTPSLSQTPALGAAARAQRLRGGALGRGEPRAPCRRRRPGAPRGTAYIFMKLYLSIDTYIYIYLLNYVYTLYIYIHVYINVYLFIYLNIYLHTPRSQKRSGERALPTTPASLCEAIHTHTYLSIYPSIHLSIYPKILIPHPRPATLNPSPGT